MNLDRYLAELATNFQTQDAADGDLLEEVRSHLEDCAYNLRLQGLSVTQSEQEALRRFGPPDDLVHAYAGLPPQRPSHRSASRRWRVRGAGMALFVALVTAATLSGGIAAAALTSSHPSVSPAPRHTTIDAPLRPRASASAEGGQ